MNTYYKSLEELPLALSVIEVGKILGISRTSAYALFNREDFPKVVIGGRKIVLKERFISWLDLQSSPASGTEEVA